MAKAKTAYVCSDCGSSTTQWQGQCGDCGAWNTLTSFVVEPATAGKGAAPAARHGGWAGRPEAAGVVALKDVSQDAEVRVSTTIGELDRVLGGGIVPGSAILIGGSPGAGKSTFFKMLSGFLTPSSGQILLFGQDITGMSPHKVARLGLVRTFQETTIFPDLTAMEHVSLAHQLHRTASDLEVVLRLPRARQDEQVLAQSSRDILALMELSASADIQARYLPQGLLRLLGIAMAPDWPLLVAALLIGIVVGTLSWLLAGWAALALASALSAQSWAASAAWARSTSRPTLPSETTLPSFIGRVPAR